MCTETSDVEAFGQKGTEVVSYLDVETPKAIRAFGRA
jgi:hypothetical protein